MSYAIYTACAAVKRADVVVVIGDGCVESRNAIATQDLSVCSKGVPGRIDEEGKVTSHLCPQHVALSNACRESVGGG
jgi:hypothetical protein